MMWRAFVPVRDKHDVGTFPMWLVSFDGQRFVEVTDKPDPAEAQRMATIWSVTVDGPKKKKRQAMLIGQPVFDRDELVRIAEIEEVPC